MDRVIAYIDGFNLYFGLKDKGWQRYYWLDIQEMVGRLLKPQQRLLEIKYFTSRVSATRSDSDKPKRQGVYLEALQTRPALRIYYGHYLVSPVVCQKCGNIHQKPTEKMTDVNIATELLCDAFQDRFDVAIIVSGDSDLAPPVSAMRRLFCHKRAFIFFPPGRFSNILKNVASASLHIGRGVLAASQFPERIVKSDGFALQRPQKWR